ncbi:hypothetical protein [Amycolatopsis sp. cg9]|uniref:hypothetical protein n=1 Tax=Amycolatopsis sp. cg9 TaxID=3238801 RepID=UPI003525A887
MNRLSSQPVTNTSAPTRSGSPPVIRTASQRRSSATTWISRRTASTSKTGRRQARSRQHIRAWRWADDPSLRTALLVARVAESRGCLHPGDWPDVAVGLLLEGAEDPAIAEPAGLSRRANGWDTEPLVAAACERHEIVTPRREESTVLVARLMADDLRARPAAVTAPMTRLAPPEFEPDLAS